MDNPGVWVGRENGVCAGVEYGLATLGEGLVPCRRPLIGGAPPLSFPLIPESSLNRKYQSEVKSHNVRKPVFGVSD